MAASSTYQASNLLECKICYNVFSEDHCPRILPCSHSFCGPCIDGLISTQKKDCPLCRLTFTANSAEDLTIIRDLLDAAKQLPSKSEGSKITSTRPKRPFRDTTKYFGESVIGKRITVCEETEVEVNDRIESNKKMEGGLEGFMQTLEGIKLSCGNTRSSIARDNKLLMDKLDILKGKGPQLKDSGDKLEAATDFASAASPMDEAEKVLQEVDDTANEIKQLLHENKGNMKQSTLRIKRAFTDAMNDLARITEELEGGSVVNITLKSLLQWSPYIPPPPPCSPIRAFLDLAYESTPLGRVIIRVIKNGLLGLNFLHMCAGGMGPSYAHSHVSYVGCKGKAGEHVDFSGHGPIIHGNATTRAVFSTRDHWDRAELRMSEIDEKMPCKAGEVGGDISYKEASMFWIVTRDGPRKGYGYCFGMVEEGLDVLLTTIQKYPGPAIEEVRVEECGLIL